MAAKLGMQHKDRNRMIYTLFCFTKQFVRCAEKKVSPHRLILTKMDAVVYFLESKKVSVQHILGNVWQMDQMADKYLSHTKLSD